MRLNLAFIVLLLTASTSTSIVWRNFAIARDGDPFARIVVLVGSLLALASAVLLARIVTKVSAVRRGGKGS